MKYYIVDVFTDKVAISGQAKIYLRGEILL